MIIERLTRDEFDAAGRNFSIVEDKWETNESLFNLERLEKLFNSQYKTYTQTSPGKNAEQLKWENVHKDLEAGKVVADMFNLYRVKSDSKHCPKCGSSFKIEEAALSRVDNDTLICSDCGVREALSTLK